jgi:thiamine phosphate synthase YjbQ (UPF0047 family)
LKGCRGNLGSKVPQRGAFTNMKVPHRALSLHSQNRTGGKDAPAYLTRQPTGSASDRGKLDIGAWEQVCYARFRGRSKKGVLAYLIGWSG